MIGARSFLVALSVCNGVAASAPAAHADELVFGVFVPEAPFATNAERSAWAERFVADIAAHAKGAFTARAQVFARREDAAGFAGRVDVLIADGNFLADRSLEVLAHGSAAATVALYAAQGTSVADLKGKVVAFASAGTNDANFYANTALAGEVVASTFFGELRDTKDATSALGAVRAGSAAAAFAPMGHPGAAGLKLLAQGGTFAIAVVGVANPAKVEPVKDALLAALAESAGGALGTFTRGPGDAYARAKAARGSPRVLTTPAILAGGVDAKPIAPAIRLKSHGKLPAPAVDLGALARPILVEPP